MSCAQVPAEGQLVPGRQAAQLDPLLHVDAARGAPAGGQAQGGAVRVEDVQGHMSALVTWSRAVYPMLIARLRRGCVCRMRYPVVKAMLLGGQRHAGEAWSRLQMSVKLKCRECFKEGHEWA